MPLIHVYSTGGDTNTLPILTTHAYMLPDVFTQLVFVQELRDFLHLQNKKNHLQLYMCSYTPGYK